MDLRRGGGDRCHVSLACYMMNYPILVIDVDEGGL